MDLSNCIFNISSASQFNQVALEVFNFQYSNNNIYRLYCDTMRKNPRNVNTIRDIPFLPIQFFKSHKIISCKSSSILTFESSGTTHFNTSKHYVSDINLYIKSFTLGFNHFYGAIEDYVILALLPSYLERNNSSLVYMVNHLIEKTGHAESGFYLDDFSNLKQRLKQLESSEKKVILIGVSFALLDFVELYRLPLKNTIVMETGGMKGRRKELVREELHELLKQGFGVAEIHSEYGMTELLSQAYSKGKGVFRCPKWMQVFSRDPEDALSLLDNNNTGGLNIIDLANFNSCAFIATQDLGKVYRDGSFEVLGRFDHSDIRGCSLLTL